MLWEEAEEYYTKSILFPPIASSIRLEIVQMNLSVYTYP